MHFTTNTNSPMPTKAATARHVDSDTLNSDVSGRTCTFRPICCVETKTKPAQTYYYKTTKLNIENKKSRTQPPFSPIHTTSSSSITSDMLSIIFGTNSGWPWRTQSSARPPAMANSATTLPHVMSGRNRSRAIVLSRNEALSVDGMSPPLPRLVTWRAMLEYSFGWRRSSSSPS